MSTRPSAPAPPWASLVRGGGAAAGVAAARHRCGALLALLGGRLYSWKSICCLSPINPPSSPAVGWLPADYGDTVAGLPAVGDMFTFFKDQLENRMATSKAPMQISTFYEW